ncbi:MAG: hypothetical protein IJ149_01710 [Oscillospiraceae bacterium]|nr:hypothetical protein [Oscillospiraceae bacterium]
MEIKQFPLPFETPDSEIITFGAQDIITISDPESETKSNQSFKDSFDI